MIHPMPTQVLLTTTFESLVKQLSGTDRYYVCPLIPSPGDC
jgi:hypothetical protein